MKKVLASLVLICIISFSSSAQNQKVRGKALGISFIMNDFNTAQQIRSGSIEQVFRNKSWSKMKDMSPGLGVTYFHGLHPNIDFAGTLNMSFLNYPFRNKPMGQGESLLLEADASVNLKMFTDDYWFTPYLIAGIGASMYENKYGAILPLGGGMKLNLF